MRTRYAVTVWCLLLACFGRLWPCECLGKTSPQQSLACKDAVFIGYVVDISQGTQWVAHDTPRPEDCSLRLEYENGSYDLCFAPDHVVTFEITTSWKGVELGKAAVKTDAQATACGYGFRVGESYLVYAERNRPTGELSTSTCSLTKLEPEAATDRLALGPPAHEAFSAKQPK